MRPKPKRNESGQILILLALALVGLLGFTALAIDGSMVYTDRRYDQSAADSASLAGAQAAAYSLRLTFVNDVPNHDQGSYETFSCTSDWVQTAMDAVFNAVRDRAATNNFTLSLSDRYYTLADLENAKYGLYVECRDQPPVTASDLAPRWSISSLAGLSAIR
jgi:Flp pilus assembly protein TadG